MKQTRRSNFKIGKSFEDEIAISATNCGLALVRIPNGAKWVGPGRMIPDPSPFDWCGVFPGRVPIFFDSKSCGVKSASFSLKKDASTRRQHDELSRLARNGARAGFLIRSEKMGRYLWIDAANIGEKPIKFTDRVYTDLGSISGLVNFRKVKELL